MQTKNLPEFLLYFLFFSLSLSLSLLIHDSNKLCLRI